MRATRQGATINPAGERGFPGLASAISGEHFASLARKTTTEVSAAAIEVKDRVTASWVSAHPAQAAAEINRLRALLALEVA